MLVGAPLDYEELRAMCGMWRANLDLEDEDEIGMRGDAGLGMPTEEGSGRSLMCHLDVRPLAVGHRTKLHTTDATVGTAQNLHWEASEVGAKVDERREPSVSSKIEVRLVLGPYVLEGTGERSGLRCGAIQGRVLRGADEEYMGRFELLPLLPAVEDAELPALQERWLRRLDTKPAPPPRYALDGFAGRWRCLLALEGKPPAVLTLSLDVHYASTLPRGRFVSEGPRERVAGSWGVYDAYLRSVSGRASKRDTAPKLRGTHLWLRVERDRSIATLEGIGGLPVRESFSMWGRPVLDSVEAELASRLSLAAAGPKTTAAGSADAAPADRVDGFAYFGAASDLEHSVAGRFSLSRAEDAEDEMGI